MKLVAFDEKNVGLDASEIDSDAMDDEFEQLVEFENVGDLLGGLLHGDEGVDTALLKDGGGRAG